MPEIAIILCAIMSLGCVYFFAQHKADGRIISQQNDTIGALRAELRDWQNKALSTHGKTPLGAETQKRDLPKQERTPGVITRAELEKREAERQGVTIHANSVAHPRTRETVEKAKEI